MLAGMEASIRWVEPILLIFVNAWLRRSRPGGCRVIGQRPSLLLGRATLDGLAAGGQPGVAKSLSILREEVDRVFALLGCSEASKLTGNHVTVVTRVQ